MDTELDDSDYTYIAKMLQQSSYSLEELKDIDLFEMFPVLQINLLNVAGEWAGFKKEWFNEKCLINYYRRYKRFFRYVTRAKNKLHYWMREDHWAEIESRWEL